MRHKRYPPTDPREWLNRAKSSLAAAGAAASDIYPEDLCFAAQQAAEKAIKAVLIRHRVLFPYVHDLKRLLNVLASHGLRIPKYVWLAEELTPFAVEARYPGHAPPVTTRQYQRALRIAKRVVQWAEKEVATP